MQFATPSETQLPHHCLTFLLCIPKEEQHIRKQVYIFIIISRRQS